MITTLFSSPVPEQPQPRRAGKMVPLAAAMSILYALCVMAALHFLPQPHKTTDYLIAGSVATLLTLVALFVTLSAARLKP